MNSNTIAPRALRTWRVTYDVVTPESAENGDTAENGFIDSAGWQTSQQSFPDFKSWQAFEPECMTLREALNVCSPQEDCGHWFAESDGRQDYSTGSEERRAMHPPSGISDASYARVRRLLGIKR